MSHFCGKLHRQFWANFPQTTICCDGLEFFFLYVCIYLRYFKLLRCVFLLWNFKGLWIFKPLKDLRWLGLADFDLDLRLLFSLQDEVMLCCLGTDDTCTICCSNQKSIFVVVGSGWRILHGHGNRLQTENFNANFPSHLREDYHNHWFFFSFCCCRLKLVH